MSREQFSYAKSPLVCSSGVPASRHSRHRSHHHSRVARSQSMCKLASGSVGAQHPFNFIVFWCYLAAFIIVTMGPKKLFPPYELFHDTSSVVERIKLVCRGMTALLFFSPTIIKANKNIIPAKTEC